MCLFSTLEELKNESDVEQKLVLPILTSQPPLGLGFLVSDFRTKPDIRQIQIGKGSSSKLYFPDYVVIMQGLPLMIIEVKRPGEDLNEALKEARLYASELNAEYPAKINPCYKVVVTNGEKIICADWDSSIPELTIEFKDINTSSKPYAQLISILSRVSIFTFGEQIYKRVRGNRKFHKPTLSLGGNSVQHQELEQNTFGTSLALDYRHIFNPTTLEDRKNIVQHAYVPSKKRLKHVQPIDRIIRAAKPPSITDARAISSTENPKEIYDQLKNNKSLIGEILLLIGSVGSGKTTFIDYLREVALPQNLKRDTEWVLIDLNDAPLAKEEIYKWVKIKMIEGLKEAHPDIDFDELSTLKKIFSVELAKVEKGTAALFEKDSIQHKELLANKLSSLQEDNDAILKYLIKYLCESQNRLLITVLDNCDKRNREDQLLMFDLAKWLQKEYASLIFLPLRDVTYDHHRKEPPLDTAIKDLVFRIDPPTFAEVIYKRVKYALRNAPNTLYYSLPNGMTVAYNKEERETYLACILRSLFQNDIFFKRLVAGLAGRNIRKGIELFLDFCKSGHISESEILKMRHSKGDHLIPPHLVTRVLFRGNRRYYNDVNSNVKNLFTSEPKDVIPDPYSRLAILRWLSNKFKVRGPNGVMGYHKVSELIKQLVPLGHNDDRIRVEIKNLVTAGCVSTESQDDIEENNITIDDEDLITIAPAGHIHLELLSNLDYLSSCSEDLWYSEQELAEKISKRLIGGGTTGHLSLRASYENAKDMVDYLMRYKGHVLSKPELYLANNSFEHLTDFTQSLKAIEKSQRNLHVEPGSDKLKLLYPNGTTMEAQVVSIQTYGIFVEFGLHATGLIRFDKTAKVEKPGSLLYEDVETGDWVKIEVINYNEYHKKFDVKILSE